MFWNKKKCTVLKAKGRTCSRKYSTAKSILELNASAGTDVIDEVEDFYYSDNIEGIYISSLLWYE